MSTKKSLAAAVALLALPLIFAANSNAPKLLKRTASYKQLKEECQKTHPELKGKELNKCVKEKRNSTQS